MEHCSQEVRYKMRKKWRMRKEGRECRREGGKEGKREGRREGGTEGGKREETYLKTHSTFLSRRDPLYQVVWHRGCLQCSGDGTPWSQFRGPVQLLLSQV